MATSPARPPADQPVLPDPAADGDAFARWMAELDEMQELRYRDPAQALRRIGERRGGWPAMALPEDALLRARFALHSGAAHLVLGSHADARQEFDLLDGLLALPELRTAEPGLYRQAQRCAIAGANASAVLAHAVGDFAGALRAYLGALDLARALADLRYEAHVLVNLANTFEESGLPAESLEHSRMALAIAQAEGMDELVGDIHHNIGNALAASGDAAGGLESNRRAFAAYAALALPQKEGYALVAVAERLFELGRLDEALAALHERTGRTADFVNQQYEAYAAYLSGRIGMAKGDAPGARLSFGRALMITQGPLADRVGQARSLLQLARLDRDDGRLGEAAERAAAALALLDGSQAQRDLLQTHELLSSLAKAGGDFAQALFHHEAFHAGYARCFNDESARKARLLAVRHEVDLAHAEAQAQRLENARLTEALAQIGARLQRSEGGATSAAAAGASAAGLPARPEDLRSLGLTPREAEVLFWVTQGKTNEDVTVILGTGMSAVKKHLGRIYEKLGVENRTAAAAAIRRRPFSA